MNKFLKFWKKWGPFIGGILLGLIIIATKTKNKLTFVFLFAILVPT